MQERVRQDPTPQEIEHRDVEHRDAAQANQRELTTADMVNPKRASDETTPAATREAEARRLHAVPAQPDAHREQPEPATEPMLSADEASGFRTRWDSIQAEFVDDPRHAVENADHLVAETIQRLAQVFADERTELERQWDRGDDVSTEDLRQALQRYRTFFQRVLAI
jgi:hypothetical protein